MTNFTVLHISDLHFGRIQKSALSSLADFIQETKSELRLIVVTGDITQRARSSQFIDAVRFLRGLDCPVFLVPGNHDVPLYNLLLRLMSPYKKFLRYVGNFSSRTYEDDEVKVFGLWTLNRFTVMSGRLSQQELDEAKDFFRETNKVRLIACHHPLDHLRGFEQIRELLPDIILSGHDHQSRFIAEDGTVLLSSGTTTSSRLRDEVNSFNLIRVTDDEIAIQVFNLTADHFEAGPEEKMKRRKSCPQSPPIERSQRSSTPTRSPRCDSGS